MLKNTVLAFCLMAAFMIGRAQQPQSPLFFHNHLEYTLYRVEHPEAFLQQPAASRQINTYHQKLDSVVGSDSFDWERWKNVYVYNYEGTEPNDNKMEEINYEWDGQAWQPTLKSVIDKTADTLRYYQWTDGVWAPYYNVISRYVTCDESRLLDTVTTVVFFNETWVNLRCTTYEYDELCRPVAVITWTQNDDGEWAGDSKYTYEYDSLGALATSVFYSTRNGEWRESQKQIYTYDELRQCVSMLVQFKGGWGPNGNNWMTAYRYDFEYQDGELVAEYYYAPVGWFGSEMAMDSKSEYEFDANGNEVLKTASVFNEEDWIVRDTYENTFDLTVNAEDVMGMVSVWESTLGQGMGFVIDKVMPLSNQWLSCSIVSNALDTEFRLYYSGFADVEECQDHGFSVTPREGAVRVESVETTDITVYDPLGRVVASKAQTQQCEFNLKPGFYLIGNGTRVVKTVVR